MYRIGQRFKNTNAGGTYILAQVDIREIALISLCNGNRWLKPVEVVKVTRITEEEFYKISRVYSGRFKLIRRRIK